MINDSIPVTDSPVIILDTFSLSFASIEFATHIPNPINENAPKNAINANICIIIKNAPQQCIKAIAVVVLNFNAIASN